MSRGRGRRAARTISPRVLTDADRRLIDSYVGESLEKAIHPSMAAMARASSATAQARNVTVTPSLLQAMNGVANPNGGMAAYMAQVMPRDPRDANPFGPMNPLVPDPLDPARRDGAQEPRLFEYPVAWNVPGSDHRFIPWKVLRDAASSVDIIRKCIEARKKDLRGLKWTFRVTEEAVNEAYAKDPKRGKSDTAAELRDKWQPEIKRLSALTANPWPQQGVKFGQWVNRFMEDHLTLDAVAVYPRTTYGGDLIALEILDGTTIKPLLDWRGARPEDPYPAFQQILYGFPRGDWRATVEGGDAEAPVVKAGFLADQLDYFVENQRSFSPYGMSAVEMALISARLYLRRQGWMLSEYDDGVTPEMILTLPDGSPIAPRTRAEWEDSLNDELGGQTAIRHRAKVLFPGMQPNFPSSVDERYKPDYDLFLIKLVAMHFGKTVQDLGMSETKGLGSSSHNQAMAQVAKDASSAPDAEMLAEHWNHLMTAYAHKPSEIEFAWIDPDNDDRQQNETIIASQVGQARMTINEARIKDGQPTLSTPEADMPFFLTGTGPVFLEGSSAPKPMVGPDGKPVPGANAGAAPITNAAAAANADGGAAPGPLDDFMQKAALLAELAKWTYNPQEQRATDGRFGSTAGSHQGAPVSQHPGGAAPTAPAKPKKPLKALDPEQQKALADRVAAMNDAELNAASAHYGNQQDGAGGQAAIMVALAREKHARLVGDPHATLHQHGKAPAKPTAPATNAPLSSAKLNALIGEHSGVHVTNSHGKLHVTLPGGAMTPAATAALKKLGAYADQHGLTITASEHGSKKQRAAEGKAYTRLGYRQHRSGHSVVWVRDPQHAHTMHKDAAGHLANDVCDQLADDYPPDAIEWVHDAKWSGPKLVPLDQLDLSGRDQWSASHDGKRVKQFAEAGDKVKPAVVVQEPGADHMMIVDGHHRTLAAEANGKPLLAYVGEVDSTSGPWQTMHTKQHRNAYDSALNPVSAPPALHDPHADAVEKAAEAAAFKRYMRRHGPDARPFVFKHLAADEQAALMPDVVKVGPHGYIHNWIFVGIPLPGTQVFHPRHGTGHVSHHEHDEHGNVTHAHVDFGNGKKHSFAIEDVNPRTGHEAEFKPRPKVEAKPPVPEHAEPVDTHHAATLHVSQIKRGDVIQTANGEWHPVKGVIQTRGGKPGNRHYDILTGEDVQPQPFDASEPGAMAAFLKRGEEQSRINAARTVKATGKSYIPVRTQRPEFAPLEGGDAEHMAQLQEHAHVPGKEARTITPRQFEIQRHERRLAAEQEALKKSETKIKRAMTRRFGKGWDKPGEMSEYQKDKVASEVVPDIWSQRSNVEWTQGQLEKLRDPNYVSPEHRLAPERFDEPEPFGGVRTQAMDAEHPLKVYGDMLKIETEDARSYRSLLDLHDHVNPETHAFVADYLANHKGDKVGIFVGTKSAPDLDHIKEWRDQPTNNATSSDYKKAGDTRQTWDEVGGVVQGLSGLAAIGYAGDWGMDTSHRHSTATHELGHVIDNALGRASDKQEWRDIHQAAMLDDAANGGRMNPYYSIPAEMWGEAFSQWARAVHDDRSVKTEYGGGDMPSTDYAAYRLSRHFNIDDETAHKMALYFETTDATIKAKAAESEAALAGGK